MQEYIEFAKSNPMLSIIWVGLVIALVMNMIKSKTAKYKAITSAELTQLINKEEGVVVDIRSKEEFQSGHITGAVHVLPTDIKSGSVTNLEKYKNTPITVVCKTGTTAAESANLLAGAGFESVHLLKGGVLAWTDAKMPLVRGKK